MLPMPVPFWNPKISFWDVALEDDVEYSLDVFLGLATALRLFFIPKVITDLTHYKSPGSKAIGRCNGIRMDTAFVIKTYLRTNLMATVALCVLQLGLCSWWLRCFERGVPDGTFDRLTWYANAIWFVLITMTTVGYGDMVPVTSFGRLVAVLANGLAIFNLALGVQLVVENMTLTRRENRTLAIIDRSRMRRTRIDKATRLIGTVMKEYHRTGRLDVLEPRVSSAVRASARARRESRQADDDVMVGDSTMQLATIQAALFHMKQEQGSTSSSPRGSSRGSSPHELVMPDKGGIQLAMKRQDSTPGPSLFAAEDVEKSLRRTLTSDDRESMAAAAADLDVGGNRPDARSEAGESEVELQSPQSVGEKPPLVSLAVA